MMRRQGQESRAWRLADGGSSGRSQRTQRRRALSWEDQSGDFSDAIPGKRRYCPGPILGPCAPGFFHPPGRFSRPGGGQSKKSPTVGNVPQARDPASGGDFASRRRAAAYVLHAYTVAALHGTVAARSVARPRCRMGLQLSSGLGIRCAERTFAYPPYSQPTSSPGVASRATLSVLRACAMTVTARADPDRYLRKYIIGALGLPTKHCHWKPYFLITHTAFSALA